MLENLAVDCADDEAVADDVGEPAEFAGFVESKHIPPRTNSGYCHYCRNGTVVLPGRLPGALGMNIGTKKAVAAYVLSHRLCLTGLLTDIAELPGVP